MDDFINHWETLGDEAKQIIIICGLIMVMTFYGMLKVLAEYDRYKYGADDDDANESEIED